MLHALSNRVLFAGAVGVVLVLVLIPFVGERDKKPARVPVDDEREAPPGSWRDECGGVGWHWNDSWGFVTWPIPEGGVASKCIKRRGARWYIGPVKIQVCDSAGVSYWLSMKELLLPGKSIIRLDYRSTANALMIFEGMDEAHRTRWYVKHPADPTVWPVDKYGQAPPNEIGSPVGGVRNAAYFPEANPPTMVRIWIGGSPEFLWYMPGTKRPS